jgi:hypothetical protein
LQNLQARVNQLAAEIQLRDEKLANAAQQLKAMQSDREVAPIEGGQWRVFNLKYVPAPEVAKKMLVLFGARALRVSTDDRTNSMILFGKPEVMEQVSGLLQQIDAQSPKGEPNAAVASTPEKSEARSLLLRVFWLADNLPESEGRPPVDFLPATVIEALHQLGLNGPRLVGQTVNSLASDGRTTESFTLNVPALLFNQPATLSCNGHMDPVIGDRTKLVMQINVAGHLGCELSGSIVLPLKHYMVLGTANSLVGAPQLGEEMGGMGMGRGRMSGGYGGRGGRAEGEAGMVAAEGGAPIGAESAVESKFKTSRFAFVVQVIDAESYAPEGESKPRPR